VRHGARRTRRVLLLAPVVAVAVLVLTACDPRQSGSAAVVGTSRISESQVNRDAQDVVAALGKIG